MNEHLKFRIKELQLKIRQETETYVLLIRKGDFEQASLVLKGITLLQLEMDVLVPHNAKQR